MNKKYLRLLGFFLFILGCVIFFPKTYTPTRASIIEGKNCFGYSESVPTSNPPELRVCFGVLHSAKIEVK